MLKTAILSGGLLVSLATPALADQVLCQFKTKTNDVAVALVEYNATSIKITSRLFPELNLKRDNDRTSVSGDTLQAGDAYMVVLRGAAITIIVENAKTNATVQWKGTCAKV